MTYNDFQVRLQDWASTAAITPPWQHLSFWVEHMVPFITEAYEHGDDAVRTLLDEDREQIMASPDSAFEWLLSHLKEETHASTPD